MSIQTELTRIINAKAAIKTAVEGKGVTVPDGTLLDGMAALIESIEAGGGGATESIISFVVDPQNNKMTSANVDAEIVPYTIFKDTGLLSVELSNKVKIIGANAFSSCYSLVLQALPSSLQVINSGAFSSCEKITISHIPSGIKSIGNYAFSYCKGLTNITFDGKPDTISESAFNSCTNITTINVPWAEGEEANAPWGATNATINYNYTGA